MESKTSPKKNSQNVAVIGAGAAGLVSARELQREGHQVVVFERNSRAGGVWVYDTAVESDPLSIDPSRTIVHTSLYDSLRTNLPRELMGFRDYPFVAKHGDNTDPRRFPSHTEVLHYLEDFTTEFGLAELIRFETEVVHAEFIEQGKWAVRSRHKQHTNVDLEEVYNAIVVCNGHYSTPRVADIPGMDVWPGKQMHSHNYRVPDPFRNKVVVLIGGSISANDIGRDIARVAKEVHVASRSNVNKIPTKQLGYNNLWLHSMIKSAHEDGSIIFHDGNSVLVDVIIHCTGYKYDFPFLDSSNIVNVDDNRVGPLYQHVFPPQLAPWISFIGLPFKTIPFILFELQSKWVAGILSGKISLLSPKEMISDINVFYSKLEEDGVPKRYTHDIFHYLFEYYDWLAAQCQFPATEEWRKLMVAAAVMNVVAHPETCRDEWVDQDLILQAYQDFIQYIP